MTDRTGSRPWNYHRYVRVGDLGLTRVTLGSCKRDSATVKSLHACSARQPSAPQAAAATTNAAGTSCAEAEASASVAPSLSLPRGASSGEGGGEPGERRSSLWARRTDGRGGGGKAPPPPAEADGGKPPPLPLVAWSGVVLSGPPGKEGAAADRAAAAAAKGGGFEAYRRARHAALPLVVLSTGDARVARIKTVAGRAYMAHSVELAVTHAALRAVLLEAAELRKLRHPSLPAPLGGKRASTRATTRWGLGGEGGCHQTLGAGRSRGALPPSPQRASPPTWFTPTGLPPRGCRAPPPPPPHAPLPPPPARAPRPSPPPSHHSQLGRA